MMMVFLIYCLYKVIIIVRDKIKWLYIRLLSNEGYKGVNIDEFSDNELM